MVTLILNNLSKVPHDLEYSPPPTPRAVRKKFIPREEKKNDQPTITKFRSLGPLEAYNSAMYDMRFYSGIIVSGVFTHNSGQTRIPDYQLYSALRNVILQHSNLASVIRNTATETETADSVNNSHVNNGKPYFEMVDLIDLRNQIVALPRPKTEKEKANTYALCLSQEIKNIDRTPPWRVLISPRLLGDDETLKDGTEIAFYYHHSIGDAISGQIFLKCFLESLNEFEKQWGGGGMETWCEESENPHAGIIDKTDVIINTYKMGKPEPHVVEIPYTMSAHWSLEELLPLPQSLKTRTRAITNVFRTRLQKSYRDVDMGLQPPPAIMTAQGAPKKKKNVWTGERIINNRNYTRFPQTNIERVKVGAREMQMLLAECRRQNTTVGATIAAVALVAVNEAVPEQGKDGVEFSGFQCAIPYDLRRFMGNPESEDNNFEKSGTVKKMMGMSKPAMMSSEDYRKKRNNKKDNKYRPAENETEIQTKTKTLMGHYVASLEVPIDRASLSTSANDVNAISNTRKKGLRRASAYSPIPSITATNNASFPSGSPAIVWKTSQHLRHKVTEKLAKGNLDLNVGLIKYASGSGGVNSSNGSSNDDVFIHGRAKPETNSSNNSSNNTNNNTNNNNNGMRNIFKQKVGQRRANTISVSSIVVDDEIPLQIMAGTSYGTVDGAATVARVAALVSKSLGHARNISTATQKTLVDSGSPWSLAEYGFCQGASTEGAAINLNMISYKGGDLIVSFVWANEVVDSALVRTVIENFKAVLDKISGELEEKEKVEEEEEDEGQGP